MRSQCYLMETKLDPQFFRLSWTLAKIGKVSLRRVYTNDHRAELWENELQKLGIEAVAVPRVKGGFKDPVDLAVALDTAELALQPGLRHISTIAIVANDSDYAIVLRRIRQWGLESIAVVRHQETITRAQHELGDAASHLVTYIHDESSRKVRAILNLNDLSNTIEVIEDGGKLETIQDAEMNALLDILVEYGYAMRHDENTSTIDRPIVPALAKFVHVNKLGYLTLRPMPALFEDAVSKILGSEPKSVWKPDPRNLIFMQPKAPISSGKRKVGPRMASYTRGSGPFLCKINPDLVPSVLKRMGYLDVGSVEDAVDHFYERSASVIKKSPLAATEKNHTRLQQLHDALVSETLNAMWKSPVSDKLAREYLCAHDYLSCPDAPNDIVLQAMHKFCTEIGKPIPAQASYVRAVDWFVQYMDRNQPDLRR